MRNSLGLALTVSAISVLIWIGGIGQPFAQETQKRGTTDTGLSQSANREGGQSGKSPHLEKRSEASRSMGESRISEQSGTEAPLEERTSSYGSMGDTRVGGQSGVESDLKKPSGKTK